MQAGDQTGGPAFEDLTARARIRDAAIRHFAERGIASATIRGIAETAGVSAGLVRHHFGSKEGLRAACDTHVSATLRRFHEQALTDGQFGRPGFLASSQDTLQPFQRYLARALVDGSAAASSMFDDMVKMTEQWLARSDERRSDPPTADRRTRAALITAMGLGVFVLHDHVSRVLGVDASSPEGSRRVSVALLDVHSHTLISEELAAAARAGYERSAPGATPTDPGAPLRR